MTYISYDFDFGDLLDEELNFGSEDHKLEIMYDLLEQKEVFALFIEILTSKEKWETFLKINSNKYTFSTLQNTRQDILSSIYDNADIRNYILDRAFGGDV
jgi:hypothetical protein